MVLEAGRCSHPLTTSWTPRKAGGTVAGSIRPETLRVTEESTVSPSLNPDALGPGASVLGARNGCPSSGGEGRFSPSPPFCSLQVTIRLDGAPHYQK